MKINIDDKSEIRYRLIILALAIAGMFLYMLFNDRNTEYIDYSEHLGETIATVDGEIITMEDLAFYIVFYEGKTENMAKIYDRKDTLKLWNTHINGDFLRLDTKDSIINNAIHDRIYYDLAQQEGIELTSEDEEALEFFIIDFWEDVLDEQYENLPISKDIINEQIRKACIAQKYQDKLATEIGPTFAAFSYDGYYYEQELKEHKVIIKNKLWDRLRIGSVTLGH